MGIENLIPNWLKEYRIIKFAFFASIFILLSKNLISLYVSIKWGGFILFLEMPIIYIIGKKSYLKNFDGVLKYSTKNEIIKQISFWFFIILLFTYYLKF